MHVNKYCEYYSPDHSFIVSNRVITKLFLLLQRYSIVEKIDIQILSIMYCRSLPHKTVHNDKYFISNHVK